MGKDCIVFSLANPTPEVDPDMAAKYAAVVATGRSDWLTRPTACWPFRGSSAVQSTPGRSITEEMKLAATTAIADVVGDDLRADYVVPSPLDRRVAGAVAAAVGACARKKGITG